MVENDQITVNTKTEIPNELFNLHHSKESKVMMPVVFNCSQKSHKLCDMHISSVSFISVLFCKFRLRKYYERLSAKFHQKRS